MGYWTDAELLAAHAHAVESAAWARRCLSGGPVFVPGSGTAKICVS